MNEIDSIETKHRLLQQAFVESRARVYKIHQALGVPVAVMRNGKIIEKLPDALDRQPLTDTVSRRPLR